MEIIKYKIPMLYSRIMNKTSKVRVSEARMHTATPQNVV